MIVGAAGTAGDEPPEPPPPLMATGPLTDAGVAKALAPALWMAAVVAAAAGAEPPETLLTAVGALTAGSAVAARDLATALWIAAVVGIAIPPARAEGTTPVAAAADRAEESARPPAGEAFAAAETGASAVFAFA